MKNLLFIILSLTTISISAQFGRIKGNGNVQTEVRNVASFDGVALNSVVDVEVIPGDFNQKIEVIAESNLIPYITTEVKNNQLIVSVQKGKSISSTARNGLKVRIKTNKIRSVSIAGSGDFTSKGKNNVSDLSISIAGSGDVEMNTTSNKVSVSIAGSGDVDLKGNAQQLAISIVGSGDVDADELKTSSVSVSVNGSGDSEVWAVDKLNVVIGGSGDVFYKGNPEITKVDNGSGSVSKKS